MRRLFVWCLLVVFASLPTPIAGQSSVPRFEQSTCTFQAPDGASVQCGKLVVLENRAVTSGPTVRLPIIVIKSRSPHPAPDPVLRTAGGPGQSSLGLVNAFWYSPLLDSRDVILFEQRGTRFAEPSLDCPEVTSALFENLQHALPVEQEIHREVAAAIVCRDRLRTAGIDLSAYNTPATVADMEDLRRVLGYRQWNLFGVSYSTQVMQHYMRSAPEGIRSVMLDSAASPAERWHATQTQRLGGSLDVLFARCSADTRCASAYPDLKAKFVRVRQSLNDDPLSLAITHPLTNSPLTLRLDGDDVASGIFNALYRWDVVAYLPLLIDQLDRGNRDVVVPLAQDFGRFTTFSWGMYYSVWCQEQLPRNDPAAFAADRQSYPGLEEFDSLIFRSDPAVCEQWGVPPRLLPSTPLQSDIPTLILAGGYDPATPPAWGRTIAQTLSRSYIYEFPGMGHAVFSSSCAQQMVAAFFNNPSTAPSDCSSSVTGAPFVTPDNVALTAGVYKLSQALQRGRVPLPLVMLGSFVLIWIGQVVMLGAMVVLWRRASPTIRWTSAIIATVALLNLIFVVVLTRIIVTTSTANPLLLGFGLPASAKPWFVLPLCSAVIALGLLVYSSTQWQKYRWSQWGYILLSAFAAGGFVLWLRVWDLFVVYL